MVKETKNNKKIDLQFLEFSNFSLYILFQSALCKLKIDQAITLIEDFFSKNPNIDKRYKELLSIFQNEWDNSKYSMCDFANYLIKANNFKELEKLISSNPDLADDFFN